MEFAINAAFVPTTELVPLAQAADRCGFGALAVADHVVDLRDPATPYPYTADGSRRWTPGTDWPDPWVLAGALGAVTERLRFFTGIYVLPMRDPFLVAKAVGTAAVLSGGRVVLGVGVGWCREEFELVGAEFTTRGRRTHEALDLLQRLWQPGWTPLDPDRHPEAEVLMEPSPGRVPVWVGGMSEVAMRRAVRHDGWIGDVHPTPDALAHVATLRRLRAEAQDRGEAGDGPFDVVLALDDAWLPEHFVRAAEGGITQLMTMPWVVHHGFGPVTPEQRIASVERFAEEVVAPVRERLGHA